MTAACVIVEASGSNREIGRAIGEAAREQIAELLAAYEENHAAMCGLRFADAMEQAAAYVAAGRRYLPQYVDELDGIAEAAGVPMLALAVANLGEEFTCNGDPAGTPAPGHCTNVSIAQAPRVVAGHNEDWYARDVETYVVARITTTDGTQIVTAMPAGEIGFTGVNSHGIANAANTVYANDSRVGLPNYFVCRWMLEARTLEEAWERACHPARARGANHHMADAAGRIWDVETSATAAATIVADGHFAHTNHYLAPEMAAYEVSTSQGSRLRHGRATELLEEGVARGDEPAELVARILTDHANAPFSICSHPDESDPPGIREQTTSSTIWDLEAMTADICVGTPCAGTRRRFALG
jgi:isopenicillin-N N-acyltransferase-like protein